MKKPTKAIIIILLLIVVYSFFKKDPLDSIEFTNELSDVATPEVIDMTKNFSVDFEFCEIDKGFEAKNEIGSVKLKITEKTSTDCVVETTFRTGDSYFTNICTIPLDMGEIEFDGISFSQIAEYCEIPASGEGLLELN